MTSIYKAGENMNVKLENYNLKISATKNIMRINTSTSVTKVFSKKTTTNH